MASAFKGVKREIADSILKMLLAGKAMKEVRDAFFDKKGKRMFSVQQMRDMRDEVFEPLITDPEKVKGLANGPVLNANEIVRYRQRPGRPNRTARPGPTQVEMFQ